MTRLTTPRRSVQFERRPSQRFSRRASYAAKRTQRQLPLQSTGDATTNKGDLINISEDTVKAKCEQKSEAKPTAVARSSKQLSPKLEKTASVGHCCKMQMSNNGGEKHDEKCNLFKAKQMKLKQKEIEANKSSPKVVRSPTKTVDNPIPTTRSKNEPCTMATANNYSDEIIQPNQVICSINDLTVNNLLDDVSDPSRCKENNNNTTNKLVDKVNIFESLDLNNGRVDANLETSHSSTTDQPLINLNESNHEPAPTVSRKDTRTALNLDIQNILEQPGTSIQRFQDLKMTEI